MPTPRDRTLRRKIRVPAGFGEPPRSENASAPLRCPVLDAHVKLALAYRVLDGGAQRHRDEIASLIGWWADAGVTALAGETPRNWLAPPPAPPVRRTAAAAPPADLAALHALLADGDYLPGAPPPRRRLPAEGKPGARLMVVLDMPDEADLRARRLLATETALFDAMLAAMGLARDAIYLVPLSPGRLTGGRLGAAAEPLAVLMRRHVSLVGPGAVILFGDETARALGAAPGGLRSLNHDGGTVAAVATIHPRVLLRRPECKAQAWTAMRQILGVLAQ